MQRTYLIGAVVLLTLVGGAYGWSRMHIRGYS
jgi:hypothetical protein